MDHAVEGETLSELIIRLVCDANRYCEITSYRSVGKMFEQAFKIMLGNVLK